MVDHERSQELQFAHRPIASRNSTPCQQIERYDRLEQYWGVPGGLRTFLKVRARRVMFESVLVLVCREKHVNLGPRPPKPGLTLLHHVEFIALRRQVLDTGSSLTERVHHHPGLTIAFVHDVLDFPQELFPMIEDRMGWYAFQGSRLRKREERRGRRG